MSLFNYSIKAKLQITAFLVSIILVASSYSQLASINRTSALHSVIENIEHASFYVLSIERHKKIFMVRSKAESITGIEEDIIHLKRELSELKTALSYLDNIDFQVNNKSIALILNELDRYSTDFKQVVILKKRVGLNQNTGLRGELRQAVHSVENKVSLLKNHVLLSDMLMLRRNEKDFMLRFSNIYIEKFNVNLIKFHQDLAQTLLPDDLEKELSVLITDYANGFQSMTSGYIALGLTSHSGLQGGMNQRLNNIDDLIEKLEDEVSPKVQNLITKAKQTSLIVAGVVLSLILSILLFISGFINKNLSTLTRHMQDIAQGSLSLNSVIKLNARGEIGLLVSAFNTMRRQLLSGEKKQTQEIEFKNKLTRLTNVLHKNDSRNELAKNILHELALCLDAHAGVIYWLKNGKMRRETCYGLAEEDYPTQTVSPKDGLVSEVLQAKKEKILDSVPPGFLKIRSSLGEATPGGVAIYPIIYNDNVIALIELAWLEQQKKQKKSLIEAASESIALAMVACDSQEEIAELLRESQAKTEELQSQSEELMSQQEELRVTNETLLDRTKALKTDQEKLKVAQKVAEEKAASLVEANRYKSEFLANMSHELRTPLNSLLILSQHLADNNAGNLTEDDVESAEVIQDSGRHLLELINDILDLSKIEAGKMDVHIDSIPTKELADNMLSRFKHMATDKSIDFVVSMNDNCPETLTTDSAKIGQILTNLIGNAIKFTSKGKVDLQISTVQGEQYLPGKSEALAFAVHDSGIGISKENQSAIFEAFRQEDGSTSRNFGGTGLGLSIALSLSQLLGGVISVESEEGKGSTFYLYLPIKNNLPKPKASTEAVDPSAITVAMAEKRTPPPFTDDRGHVDSEKKCILIVEDDAVFSKILYKICHEKACQAIVAPDGETALTLVKEYDFNGIVLDYMLPGINGSEVLKQLKNNQETKHLPVHMITALDSIDDDIQALGVQGLTNKPINNNEIISIINSFPINTDVSSSVLVVDAQPDELNTQMSFFREKNITAKGVSTTQAALGILREDPTVHIMILDLDLDLDLDLETEDMSGFEFLETINADSSIDMPAVIIYTHRHITDKDQARLEPFTDHIIIKSMHSKERLLDEIHLFANHVSNTKPEIAASQAQAPNVSNNQKLDPSLKGKTLLLVDDDMRNTFALAKVLRQKGLKIKLASSGEQSLEILNVSDDVALVLMDIMMPEMDGYETMQKIRENLRFKDLAIIALTANAMKGDKEKCLKAGANDYLSKPVDLGQLMAIIKLWL